MLKIRKTAESDLIALMPIFDEARSTIAALGIDQWQNGYPNREVILSDIAKDQHSFDADNRPLSTYSYKKIRCFHVSGVILPS